MSNPPSHPSADALEAAKQCRSVWDGHRCVLASGHDGIHVAADQTDWIEGDTVGDILLRFDTLARNVAEYRELAERRILPNIAALEVLLAALGSEGEDSKTAKASHRFLAVPMPEDAAERLCTATYFLSEWLHGHEDEETCVLPVDHVQTLIELADAVVTRSGQAVIDAALSTPGDANAQ